MKVCKSTKRRALDKPLVANVEDARYVGAHNSAPDNHRLSPLLPFSLSTADLGLKFPAYSIDGALQILPFGRTELYAAMASGQLKYRKRGKRRILLAPDIAEFLSCLPSDPERADVQATVERLGRVLLD